MTSPIPYRPVKSTFLHIGEKKKKRIRNFVTAGMDRIFRPINYLRKLDRFATSTSRGRLVPIWNATANTVLDAEQIQELFQTQLMMVNPKKFFSEVGKRKKVKIFNVFGEDSFCDKIDILSVFHYFGPERRIWWS